MIESIPFAQSSLGLVAGNRHPFAQSEMVALNAIAHVDLEEQLDSSAVVSP